MEIYKLSLGIDYFKDEDYNFLKDRNQVSVHPNTKAKGQSNIPQGELFLKAKKGDLFYVCRSNQSVEFIGAFTEDDVVKNFSEEYESYTKDGWAIRNYKLLFDADSPRSYDQSHDRWWAPVNNSTFVKIPVEHHSEFEDKLLKPVFGKTLKDLSKRISNKINLMNYFDILKYKKQLILQGPPGTGKTYMAKKMAEELTNSRDDYKIIQFHPSYTYEDFVRGISAESNNGEVIYETKNKVFAEFAEKASKNLIDRKKKAEVVSKEEAIRKVIDLYTDDFVESDKPHYQLSGTRLVDIHDGKFIYKIKKGGDHKFSISIDEVTIGLLNNVSDYDSVKELNISQSTKSKYRSFINICDAIYKEYENKIEGIRNNLGVGAIESPERRSSVA